MKKVQKRKNYEKLYRLAVKRNVGLRSRGKVINGRFYKALEYLEDLHKFLNEECPNGRACLHRECEERFNNRTYIGQALNSIRR